MKRFLNPCRRKRESLYLLASGLLPERDRAGIENHLAQCADCRSYYNEIRMVAVPLAAWEKHFAHIEPDAAIQLRLKKAIVTAGKPESLHPFAPKIVLRECWQQLIWPSRHIWTGLAAVWVLILAVNFSLRDHSPAVAAKSAPAPQMMLTFRQQERLLNELIGPDETTAARPATPFVPQPRSARIEATAV